MIDFLAIGAHPDDVEIGCGGALLLATGKGQTVALADLTAAESSTRGTPQTRAEEKAHAARLIGAERHCLHLPDTRLNPADEDQQLALVTLIRRLQPAVVLAPYPTDKHPDHAAAGVLVRQACYLAGVGKVGQGTPHRPKHLFYYMLHEPFTPSFVVDISPVWDAKQGLIAAYPSQFGGQGAHASEPQTAISQPRFLQVLTARAVWFGAMIGADYGEAFYSPAPVPLDSLPHTPAYQGLPPYNPFM